MTFDNVNYQVKRANQTQGRPWFIIKYSCACQRRIQPHNMLLIDKKDILTEEKMTGSKLGAGLVSLCVSTATSLFQMATFNGSHWKCFILTLNNVKICQEPAWTFVCSLNILYLRGILWSCNYCLSKFMIVLWERYVMVAFFNTDSRNQRNTNTLEFIFDIFFSYG